MRKIYLSLLLSLFALVTTRTNAQGIYMSINDITTNGSEAPNHRNEVRIYSIQYGISSEASFIKGGGPTVSKPNFSALTLTKSYDISSIDFISKMTSGKSIPRVDLNFYDPKDRTTYRIRLEDVFVTSYETSSSGECEGGCPGLQESVSFVFKQYIIFETDSKGGGLQQKFGFDVSQNKQL
ncbi:type VI secretion system tube protein Hcp [Siphonobacter curvatus]|uniref:Type VI secretion system tube protein Hcp n=1 Tax=Siphonobacter curvatus TaxID=2094562 RepID=A0A2S7IPL5_9BACT|nr:type VI secretion system tube protein Hcp [Siphonobacter curvatus]PQA59609.1 hypothetical protein C5O19_08205 [Siphonobacter curvatus]